MKFNLKKRFKGFILAASLAAVGCNPTYAGGIGDRVMTVLGSFVAGSVVQGMTGFLNVCYERLCLSLGSTPKYAIDNEKKPLKEWTDLAKAYADGDTKAKKDEAWRAWGAIAPRGIL